MNMMTTGNSDTNRDKNYMHMTTTYGTSSTIHSSSIISSPGNSSVSPIEIFGASKDSDDDNDDNDDGKWSREEGKKERNDWMRETIGQSKEGGGLAVNLREKVVYTSSSSYLSLSNEKFSTIAPTANIKKNKTYYNNNNDEYDKEEEEVDKNSLKGLLLWNHDNSVDYYDIRDKTRVSHYHVHHFIMFIKSHWMIISLLYSID